MADQSDVENALVALASDALYPNGSGGSSVAGPDCRVYRGWPNSAALNSDLTAGIINVTVFPQGDPGHNTTRYLQERRQSRSQPTLTASASGVSVTIGGIANAGQLVGIFVDKNSYVYGTQAGDTPETVAANLASSVASDWIVNCPVPALTVPGAGSVMARVVAEASVMQEVRRQEQGFRITCWCPTPATRDITASAIDLLLVGFQFIDLWPTDPKAAYNIAGHSYSTSLRMRCFIAVTSSIDVEYPTTVSALQPAMLFGDLILNAGTFTV